MQTNKLVRSLKSPLFYLHTVFVCIVTMIIFTIVSYFFISQNQADIKENIKEWANIVYSQAQQTLLQESRNSEPLSTLLINFKHVSDINFVYVYKKEPQGVSLIDFHNKTPLLTSVFPSNVQVEILSSPTYANNAIELIKPVLSPSQQVIGYIHIQAASRITPYLINGLIIAAIIMLLIVSLTSLLLVSIYYQKLMKQMSPVIATIQDITKYKNYRTTFQRSHYKEIDALTNLLNIMLSRVEKDLSLCEISKKEVFNLNSHLENKITNRTEDLKESNKELLLTLEKLHQFQSQLVENEKMASLGDMVAGIAHEINTPIGLGVTASSMLEDKLSEIQKAYNEKTLKGSELKRFLNESEKNISIVTRNLNRAAELISSFKQVAVDQSSEEPRRVNVKQLINEICTTLAPQLSHTNYNININCDPDLEVNIKAGPVNQILINLIMNSKIHGFNNSTEGDIEITVMNLSNQLNIIYQDNGVGIDESIRSKIFEPFITTKRGEGGSGLGLHLVYNLVTQALGGSIEINSLPNNGVTFELNIPI